MRHSARSGADWPWNWRPVDLDEFTAELRGEQKSLPTVRAYQGSLRQFLDLVSDPRYQWSAVCKRLFGTQPAQICFEWNTVPTPPTTRAAPPGDRSPSQSCSACSTTPTSKVGAARTAAGRAGWRHCGTRQRRRSPTPGVCDPGSHLKQRPRSMSTCRADLSPPRIGAVAAASVTMTSVEALEASWPCTTWLTRHRLG